jgi:regulator of sirC expression with transglutaminase-like and TPR domain
MAEDPRQRLLRLVRRPDADLDEAALLCAAELSGDLDVDATLLRLDALADDLRSRGFVAGEPTLDADALTHHLAVRHGFSGDSEHFHDPANSLLDAVLERRRGLPITLSIVYVAIGRRLGVSAYPIALPGHVVTGIGGADRPVVVDPFHAGRRLDEAAISERVTELTGGRLSFRRAMLRPTPAVNVVRRLLSNLTRDLTRLERYADALTTVDLRLLLPNRLPDDHRVRGQLLGRLGRFDEAAAAYERYLEVVSEDAPDREEIRRAAISSRARLN